MSIQKPFVRHPYNYDWAKESDETGLACADVSRTVQSQAEDADINVIVKRFGLTGQVPANVRVPSYEDFGDTVFDYRSALDAINLADRSFMAMPANVRARFHNSPQEFLEYCQELTLMGRRWLTSRKCAS